MGFRNSLGRTIWMLALALAVGNAVALMGGEERSGSADRAISSIAHDPAPTGLGLAQTGCPRAT
jgi:acyl-CoA reductase-like NAD-dependent aldehyde dehydrogenase